MTLIHRWSTSRKNWARYIHPIGNVHFIPHNQKIRIIMSIVPVQLRLVFFLWNHHPISRLLPWMPEKQRKIYVRYTISINKFQIYPMYKRITRYMVQISFNLVLRLFQEENVPETRKSGNEPPLLNDLKIGNESVSYFYTLASSITRILPGS